MLEFMEDMLRPWPLGQELCVALLRANEPMTLPPVCFSLSFLIYMRMGLRDRVQHCCEHCACVIVSPI